MKKQKGKYYLYFSLSLSLFWSLIIQVHKLYRNWTKWINSVYKWYEEIDHLILCDDISYFDFAIPFYRLEQWWDLLSEVLQYSLDCCYHLHLLSCAVEYSLELLAPRTESLFLFTSVINSHNSYEPNGNILFDIIIRHSDSFTTKTRYSESINKHTQITKWS